MATTTTAPKGIETTQLVEETYEVDLQSADFKKIKTVGDIVDLVVARVD